LIGVFKPSILKAQGLQHMAAVKFRKSYGIVLHLLDPDGGLERLVSPMGASICSSIKRIEGAARSADEMSAGWITDD